MGEKRKWTGTHYDAWEVIGEPVRVNDNYYLPCRCACGTTRLVCRPNLMTKRSRSCGCVPPKERSELVKYQEVRKTASAWAREKGLQADTVRWRLKNKWSVEDALEKPVRECRKK